MRLALDWGRTPDDVSADLTQVELIEIAAHLRENGPLKSERMDWLFAYLVFSEERRNGGAKGKTVADYLLFKPKTDVAHDVERTFAQMGLLKKHE